MKNRETPAQELWKPLTVTLDDETAGLLRQAAEKLSASWFYDFAATPDALARVALEQIARNLITDPNAWRGFNGLVHEWDKARKPV